MLDVHNTHFNRLVEIKRGAEGTKLGSDCLADFSFRAGFEPDLKCFLLFFQFYFDLNRDFKGTVCVCDWERQEQSMTVCQWCNIGRGREEMKPQMGKGGVFPLCTFKYFI